MKFRFQVPERARRGEVVPVRLMIAHPMETGMRRDDAGRPVPKNLIGRVVCRYNGEEVFRAELGTGVAANPYLRFHTVAADSGEIECTWSDDSGERGEARARISVIG